MTKLSKAPPPAYSGKTPSPGSLEAAVPYENMRQNNQPPVPVTTAVLPSSYNDPLPDTNPFSPNFKPGPVSNAPQPTSITALSAIAEPEPTTRSSEAPLRAPLPQRPAEQRRSVELRRLDGKPYPNANGPAQKEKPKVVKVAKDMFDGALPPVYKRQATDPVLSSTNTTAAPNSQPHGCGKCGKRRGAQSNGHSCNDCGKRKTTTPAPITPSAPVNAPAVHSRAISESQTSHGSSRMSEQSTAGPSSSPSSSTHSRGCCDKCGRFRRPSPVSSPFDQGRPNGVGPATAPVPMAGHPAMRPGLSIHPNAPGNNAAYPKIDVIPPSAATYKVNSPFSTYGDDSPLVGNATKQEFKLFRNSSLIRSLSRRLSKKDKNVAPAAPLPSQQLARQSGEQSAGNLINMISTAMQGPAQERDNQYARLETDRPETPFSFVGGKDERDGFEMVDIDGGRPSISTQDSWTHEPIAPQISVTHSDSDMVAGVQQDHIDVIPRPKSTGPQHLTVETDGDRPPITRFKSLRVGVQRMGSGVSRSTSLRRLGSLKTVHHAWYVEGSEGNNENIIPAF